MGRADDQVVETVAVHIAGRRDGLPGEVARCDTADDEAGLTVQGRQIQHIPEAGGAAEDDIGLAGIGSPGPVGVEGTDQQVVDAVAVDVPRRGHRMPRQVQRGRAGDGEAHGGGHGRQVQIGPETARPAEHDIGLAGVLAPGRIGIEGTDDQIRPPVAVQVAGRGDRPARVIPGVHARDGEAVGPAEGAKVEGRAETAHAPEHDKGLAGIGPPARIALGGPDDQIVDAVAVDVSRRRDGIAAPVGCIGPEDGEAVGPGQPGHVELGGEPAGPAEHHIAGSRVCLGTAVRFPRAEDQVVEAVTVDVARGRDGEAEPVSRRATPEGHPRGAVQCGQVQAGAEAARAAEDQIGLAGIGPLGGLAPRCPDQEVGQPVPVDVSRRLDAGAAEVEGVDAGEGEALRGGQVGEVERCAETALAAVHHIADTGVRAAGRIRRQGPDQQVVAPVAVDVADARDGIAAAVARGGAVDHEAVRSIDRRGVEHALRGEGRSAPVSRRIGEAVLGRLAGAEALEGRADLIGQGAV